MKRNIFLSSFCLILIVLFAKKANAQLNQIVLSNPDSGYKTYVASQQIQFLPGYSYTASSSRMIAYIEDGVVTPAYFTDLYSSTTFNQREINLNYPVGSTSGSPSVTETGGFNFSFPIQLPIGTNNMVPQLGVGYNSQSGNGLLGMGWNLQGLSMISRTNKNRYFDEEVRAVKNSNEDVFAIDGNRLIVISGTYGNNGSIYANESEDFSRVYSFGTQGNGPEWFQVKSKDGFTIEYGKTTNSKLLSNGNALFWMINKISDAHGNYIEYVYENVNGDLRIKEILYTGNIAANQAPYNKIQFSYKERPDAIEYYIAGKKIKTNAVLDKITVLVDGQQFKKYEFIYGCKLYSFLNDVIEYGLGNERLNSTIFKYETENTGAVEITDEPLPSRQLDNNNYNNDNTIYMSGDLNGDGKANLLKLSFTNSAPTSISLSSAFVTNHINYQILNNSESDELNFQTIGSSSISSSSTLTLGYNTAGASVSGMAGHGMNLFDFDGDSKADLFYYELNYNASSNKYNIANVIFHKSQVNANGQVSFNRINSPIANNTSMFIENINQFSFVGDFNGDGIADVLYVTKTENGPFSAKIANGGHGNAIYATFGVNTQLIVGDLNAGFLGTADRVDVIDFDGDGKSDILIMKDGITRIYTFKIGPIGTAGAETYNYSELLYQSSIFANIPYRSYGDFNGDGKTDILFPSFDGINYVIYYSTGIGFETNVFSLKNSRFNSSTDEIIALDLNGDGKSDFIHKYDDINMSIYYSNGSAFDNLSHTFLFPSQNTGEENFWYEFELNKIIVGNFTDNSIPSLIVPTKYFIEDRPYDYSDYYNNTIIVVTQKYHHLNLKLNPYQNFLSAVKDGFNNEVIVEYGNLGNYTIGDYATTSSNPSFSPNYPVSNFNYPLPFVSKLSTSTSTGSLASRTYEFWGGKFHKRGKGFLGFSKVVHHDLLSGFTNSSEYSFHETIFQKKLDKTSVYYTDNEDLISENEYTYTFHTSLPNNRFMMYVSAETNQDYVNDRNLETTYNYNTSTGNLTSTTTNNNAIESIVTNYEQYGRFGTELTFPNKLMQSTTIITRVGENPFSKTEKFDYNPKGDLIQVIDFFGLAESITKDIEFDLVGNITKETISAIGIEPREKSYEYDTKKRNIIKHINELQQESFMEYHPVLGTPTKVTDIHGLITETSYDAFGRQVSLIDPLGNVSSTVYQWVNGNPSFTQLNPLLADDIMWKIVRSGTGKPTQTTYLNRFGLERKVTVEGMQNDVQTVTSYNEKGQTTHTTAPFFDGASEVLINVTTYDPLNRVIQSSNQAGVASVAYSVENGILKTTTTAPDGTSNFVEEDATGKLIKSSDEGGVITYTYFSHGGVKEIKLDGVLVAQSEYDEYARQSKLIDANAGEINYVYNALGDVISQVNANNETTSMQYDAVGRLISKTIPNRTVSFEFYTEGNGLNQVKKILTAESIQEFVFDDFQRPIESSKTIEGQLFTYKYTYNTLGEVDKIEYPDGFFINHLYDSKGYLTQILNPNATPIWTADEQDAMGRIVKYTKGDGIQTEMDFDYFGRLNEIKAGTVQHNTYSFNLQNGNLENRTDLLKGLEENFTYDNIKRLKNAQSINSSSNLVLNLIETTYESNGNIASKTDAGVFTYDSEKFNAVVHVENPQAIPMREQEIEYNAFAKTSQITENNLRMYFTYGADEERIVTTLVELDNGNETLLRKKYFTGLYEREIEGNEVRHIRYVMAGDGLTAIVVKENSENDNTYFTYKDHLGSIVTLTDENAAVFFEQSFDAWGRYRNTDNWTYDNITEAPSWLRGYTGHEHLEVFALINMNGRMYDPVLGRMLRPDNFVQDPLFSQSYNRYSYAWNNPLSYTDPDGEFVVAGIVIGAIVGAYIGGSIANNSFSPSEWAWSGEDAWKTYTGMAIGALAGGLGGNAIASAKMFSAKAFAGKSFAGTMNAMYNYEKGQGALTTLGYFGAGFGGASLGLSVGAASFGMFTGGMFTSLVYSADALASNKQLDSYVMAQKFIGGALTSYAGMSLANSSYGYLKVNGKYFGGEKIYAKGASYALQNHASNFAYTAQDKYNLTAKQLLFSTASGFLSGMMNYAIKDIKFDVGKETFSKVLTMGVRTLGGFANYWILDYAFNHDNMYGTYYGGANSYKYKGQKAGIGATKNIFMYLNISK
jgi:RHS repeat-associated protein